MILNCASATGSHSCARLRRHYPISNCAWSVQCQGVELLDHKRATELLEKAKKDAEAELKRLAEREALKDKKQDKDNEAAAANQKKKSAMRQGGIPPGDFMLEGFVPAGGAVGWDAGGIQSWLGSHKQGTQVETEEEVVKDTTAPDDAVFETLNDGSTALLIAPGLQRPQPR